MKRKQDGAFPVFLLVFPVLTDSITIQPTTNGNGRETDVPHTEKHVFVPDTHPPVYIVLSHPYSRHAFSIQGKIRGFLAILQARLSLYMFYWG